VKKISIVVPTLNEVENVELISEAIIEAITKLKKYDYEIVFIDNFSTDGTRDKLEKLCSQNNKIKAIFNKRNFGGIKSPIYAILQTTGDAVITLCADFQDPPDELIPKFVAKWEEGYEAVCGVKVKLLEGILIKSIRKFFYNFAKKHSEVPQIKHFDGIGLYSREAVEQIRKLSEVDSEIQLRNLPTDLGLKYAIVEFVHQKRRFGKTKNGIFELYKYAINILVNYTRILYRASIGFSFIFLMLSTIAFLITLYFNITNGIGDYIMLAYIVEAFMFFTAFPLMFIGLLGEYIYNIKQRITVRPFVIEEKRINF